MGLFPTSVEVTVEKLVGEAFLAPSLHPERVKEQHRPFSTTPLDGCFKTLLDG